MNPIIFGTKYFTLHTFWVFFAVGLITSIFTIIKLSVKNGLKLHFLSENSWKLILWAILGARIIALAENYKAYFYGFNLDGFFRLFAVWDKGLNIWGALIGLILAFFFLCRKHEQNFWKWLEVFIPAIIIGLAAGHLGAFFDGTNYGSPTSLPWGVNFESPSIKYTVPIHPTQIYAFLHSAGISTLLILLNQNERIKKIEKPGFIGILGIILYGFFAFLEEFLRGDDTLMIFGIRTSQIIALAITISAGVILYLRYNKPNKKSKKSK